LKTTYYLRTVGATHAEISHQKATATECSVGSGSSDAAAVIAKAGWGLPP
jgi:hypothetical protein